MQVSAGSGATGRETSRQGGIRPNKDIQITTIIPKCYNPIGRGGWRAICNGT